MSKNDTEAGPAKLRRVNKKETVRASIAATGKFQVNSE